MLGLGNKLSNTSTLVTPGIVTDNLVMKHMYPAGAVQPLSDGAAYFGGVGSNDRINITETVFNVDGAAYTFAFWAKRNVLSTTMVVMGHSSTANEQFIRFNTSNEIKIESDTASDVATITQNTNDTNWHHYAITITGSGATIVAYQDGVLCADSGNVGDDNMTINIIGASTAYDYEFNGYLCNIGIWEAVLTQPQVKSIMWKQYADLTTTESADLIHWWALDKGTGTSAADSKGGNTGTLPS
jgi:hypothetical protein